MGAAMARAGDVLEHPVTGERFVVQKASRDTSGELLELDFAVRPGGFIAAEHVHPKQEERFELTAGTARFRIRGEEGAATAGDTVVIPPGTPHVWWNDGGDELRVLIQFRPALRTETFFETFFGLAKDGKTNAKGLPNPLQAAVALREFSDEIRLARPPFWVQKVAFGLLAPLGRLVGYRARYPQYSSP
jgi:quercetin dioxygenase-like cupin family protein